MRYRVLILALFLLVSPELASSQDGLTEPQGVDPRELIGEPVGPPLSGDELDLETDALAAVMRCPVCQALSVADSPTVSAMAMKEEARDLLAAGYSREQVLEYFEKSYGEFILLEPKKRGLNLLVWLAPLVALVIGGTLIGLRTRAKSASEETEEPEEDPMLAAYAERVRREVGG
jgi:cytochrome c-type biogenesis protein CcmH